MAGIFGNNFEDRYFERQLDRHLASIDALDKLHDERIESLTEEYMDDDEILWDVVMDESLLDSDAFTATLRAMTNAYALGRDADMNTFAKSIAQSVLDAVAKKAERDA